MNDLSRYVRANRNRLGLTQGELAEMLDVNAKTIQNIENGHTQGLRRKALRALAVAFERPRAEVLAIAGELTDEPVDVDETVTLIDELLAMAGLTVADLAKRLAARRGMVVATSAPGIRSGADVANDQRSVAEQSTAAREAVARGKRTKGR